MGQRAAIVMLVIAGLIAAVGLLVFRTGGTTLVWPHLMYVPIILSAAAFRVTGGIAAALAAGLVLGPFMPLDTLTGTPQSTANWLFRLAFFLLVAAMSGFLFKWLNDQLDRVKQQSITDGRTGLPNLACLRETLEEALTTENGERGNILVAVSDVGNAKEIINTLGYRSTEVLAEQIVARLREVDRNSLSIFKLPGQRFAVLGREMAFHRFIEHCKALLHLFEEPFHFEEIPVVLNLHTGIAQSEINGITADEMIQKASAAAQLAASKGKPYVAYSPKEDAHSIETLGLLGSLNKAISDSELQMYFQPKINIKSNQVEGAESLVRWIHPTKGMIRPDSFIPQVEETWLVHPLSLFAITGVLEQLKKWENADLNLKLAVNLTAQNIQDRSLIAKFVQLVKDYGINPVNLEVEITERSLLTEMDTAAEVLNLLHNMGASISIDDFGTGFSTIHYIRELPIDALKIDQSFVKDLTTSEFSRAVVRRIIEAAQDLNLKTIAEGVESKEILDTLNDLGCDLAQGYYISRPLPGHEFSSWLQTSSWKVN
jgi:EAL domain-containing protein (putative c-di-GMP-specific phosphodiesterase class I)